MKALDKMTLNELREIFSGKAHMGLLEERASYIYCLKVGAWGMHLTESEREKGIDHISNWVKDYRSLESTVAWIERLDRVGLQWIVAEQQIVLAGDYVI